jgi:hypothetical protein
MKIVDALQKKNEELKSETTTQLALCQEAGKDYDKATHVFLEQTLGMYKSKTVEDLNSKAKAIDTLSIKLETANEFQKIKETFGKDVIGYKGLVELCNKYNLYFGPTPLFKGNMTLEAIEEAKAFDFVKARSHLSTLHAELGKSVLKWERSSGSDLIIVAPIEMFELHSEHKVIISNNEIIPCNTKYSLYSKKKCKVGDPVLLMPFSSKGNKKIYFIILTNWE